MIKRIWDKNSIGWGWEAILYHEASVKINFPKRFQGVAVAEWLVLVGPVRMSESVWGWAMGRLSKSDCLIDLILLESAKI